MQNQDELDRLAEELTLRREVDEYGTILCLNEKGELHRVYGPALTYASGTEFWYQNGKIHRLDGPALVWSDGLKYWYIHDLCYTEEQFNAHPLVMQHRAKAVL